MTESLQIWNSGNIPKVVQECRTLASGDQCNVSITKSPIHPLARVVNASEPIAATDLAVRLQRELPAPEFRIDVVNPTQLSIRRS